MSGLGDEDDGFESYDESYFEEGEENEFELDQSPPAVAAKQAPASPPKDDADSVSLGSQSHLEYALYDDDDFEIHDDENGDPYEF